MVEKNSKKRVVKRSLLRDVIRDVIQKAILSKELKPGTRIVETQWAEELGVSKAPVREAIRELEAIGLLENKPFRGSYVRVITTKELEDAYSVRMVLEEIGIRQASERITQQQLQEMKNILKEMEDAAQKHLFELYIQKNTEFHQKIIEAADNKMLLNVWRQANVTQWTSVVTQISERTLENLAQRHEEIYEILCVHDPEMAAKLAKRHHSELINESIESPSLK